MQITVGISRLQHTGDRGVLVPIEVPAQVLGRDKNIIRITTQHQLLPCLHPVTSSRTVVAAAGHVPVKVEVVPHHSQMGQVRHITLNCLVHCRTSITWVSPFYLPRATWIFRMSFVGHKQLSASKLTCYIRSNISRLMWCLALFLLMGPFGIWYWWFCY